VSWSIVRLARTHDRSRFHCGQPTLDGFLRELAFQYEKRNLGRTYVLTRDDEVRVLGYYSLASGAIAFESLPADIKLPRHPIPVILLGRLAVDESIRGQGLGERLLVDALSRCLDLAEPLGVHAVEVHAIDDAARAFYLRYGFISLQDDPHHLYLPLKLVRNALR